MIKATLKLLPLLLLFACSGNTEEPRVMTRQGGMQAEIRSTDAVYKRITKSDNLQKISLSIDEVLNLKTEYAFWRSVDLYLEDNQLAMARLGARAEDNGKFEEFYYDRDGKLVLAFIGNDEGKKSYYFLIDRLVMVLGDNQDTIKIDSPDAKLASINLIKEADKLQVLANQQ